MPYACSAFGGRVQLSPSREESYRIYGQREERPYTVCSPINPNACRTWLLHRFELDCGGTRVDWLSVVEAASDQTTGRAWVEGGRLRMRMNQYWGGGGGGIGPDDDPYPRWRRQGPYGDNFPDRGMRRRGAVVEMPPGFAPAFGLPIRFVPSDLPGTPFDPRAGAEAPSKGGVPKSAGIDRDMPGPLVRDLPPREPLAKEPVAKAPAAKEPIAKDPTAKTPQVAGSVTTAPSNVPKSEPAVRPAAKSTEPSSETAVQIKPKAPEKAPEPAREVAAADPATTTGTVTVVPKIINRPAGAEPSTVGQTAAAKPATPITEKAPDPVLPKVAEVKPKIDATPAAKPSIPFDVSPGPSTLTAVTPSSTTQALVGFAALVALALGLFVWARRRRAGVRQRQFRRTLGLVEGRHRAQPLASTGRGKLAAAAGRNPEHRLRRRTSPAHARGGMPRAGHQCGRQRGRRQEDRRGPAAKLASRPRHRHGRSPAARAAHHADQRRLGHSVRQASDGLNGGHASDLASVKRFADPQPVSSVETLRCSSQLSAVRLG